ncbi:hypothetical protein ACWDA7_44155 [Streptomyces sp. NPDC001156]
MTAHPGADELRIRSILKQRGVGPDAEPAAPPVPPIPRQRPRDWLDDVLDGNADPVPEPVEEAPPAEADPPAEQPAEPKAEQPRKPKQGNARKRRKRQRGKNRRRTGPAPARSAWDGHSTDPRQSLADAWYRVPYRLKWLAIHAAAAGVGWRIGLVQWATNTAAWFAAGHWAAPSAWVLYLLGVLAVALYRATRRQALLVALATAVPVSSVVVGVLLYGTGYQP